MHARLVGLLVLCEHAGRPGEKVSRYAGCPGTQGLTLPHFFALKIPAAISLYFPRVSFEINILFLATVRGLPSPLIFLSVNHLLKQPCLGQSLPILSSTPRHSKEVASASLESDDTII
ncbi:hypothetical protein COCMIDRAFT_107003 [Bipolaris oryzae ATCC 44560]|uniref:Uncharacterized protein n=1 Tax=Bipolaris oryzae ATCC 44560 TaxID=930090 RepID=W6YUA6_COCMI|nr:uncharacterized protein COCMIDRAFT_107003 [Bipolaris oryzae ATCC 44560]EUC41140.1 hypothetical protein COCMIDRAFT_107003 [Bipolaris oryzae ATCC 44560]